jgi:hypothetical protein
VQIDPPRTELIKTTVFADDATAKAAIIDIYYNMRVGGFASGGASSISLFASIASDESLNYYTAASPSDVVAYQQFYNNALHPDNLYISLLWNALYKSIYKANVIIDGLAASKTVSESLRIQLTGEAKFIRAFCNFYLVNFWGDVPLATSTDYEQNAKLPRTPATQVYQFIIDDLVSAQMLLADDYSQSNNERVRPNKGAAAALLARTYLYAGDWPNAETTASAVISNTTQYHLVENLSEVFRANSSEAIFQLWNNYIATERLTFFVYSYGADYCALRPEFAKSFENGDDRNTTWVGHVVVGGDTLYYPRKYLSIALPPEDYSTVLRLSEQYLIRAEARAQQGDIAGAQADINIIRNRAGVGDTPANDTASLLTAIEEEKKHELFTEWGHRWLDLKRTGRIDAVLGPLKPQWASTAALFPIPEYQLLNDPAMQEAQNPGY